MSQGQSFLQKFLKVIFRATKILVCSFIVLLILLTTWFFYSIHGQTEQGKLWCENIIREYEIDREKFIEKHSDDMQNGQLYVRPSEEQREKVARALFQLEDNGEYECSYAYGGFASPHKYTYYSKTREWVATD